jgi:Domain of unknown function (DUF4338)
MSTTATAPALAPAITDGEFELTQAWERYQTVEKHGLDFGKVCYDLRNQFRAQGSHKGRGFEQLCTKLSVPRRTAYFWIGRYEESVGLRAVLPEIALPDIERPDVETSGVCPPATASWRQRIANRESTGVRGIRLEQCSNTDPRYESIRADHYVENNGCVGMQVHFLVWHNDEIAGIISGGSAIYASNPRDTFFGITKENRKSGVLDGIVNNTVFRLVNAEPNLATRVLAVWREVVAHIWYAKYGVVVYGFETLVVEESWRRGTLYKADNWAEVGKTEGQTKNSNGLTTHNWTKTEPKLIYCKWRSGFNAPCAVRVPDWVRGLTGGVQ